jgi:hypothetical protein
MRSRSTLPVLSGNIVGFFRQHRLGFGHRRRMLDRLMNNDIAAAGAPHSLGKVRLLSANRLKMLGETWLEVGLG